MTITYHPYSYNHTSSHKKLLRARDPLHIERINVRNCWLYVKLSRNVWELYKSNPCKSLQWPKKMEIQNKSLKVTQSRAKLNPQRGLRTLNIQLISNMVQLQPQLLKCASMATLMSKCAVAMQVPAKKTVFKWKKGRVKRYEVREGKPKMKAVCLL